jgi:ABC-type branched-subunit amino acid transport system permease subunit
MRAKKTRRNAYVAAGLLGAGFLLPFLTSDTYLLIVIGSGLLFGILAMSLDLLWGYSGILNLAPALSFGIGAYSWGIVSDLIEGPLGTLLALPVWPQVLPSFHSGRARRRYISRSSPWP